MSHPPSHAPRSRFVRANHLEHHVLEWEGGGGPAARTVVTLHGYLDQARSFAPFAGALAHEGYRVLAIDLRGHGETGWVPPGGYYHFPDYIADVTALLEALAPVTSAPAIALVGHSMGGTVATLLAGTYPARVGALVLAEGMGPPAMPPEIAPHRTRAWLEGLARARERRRRMATLDDAVERLRASHGATVSDAVLRRAAGELTMPDPDDASGTGLVWRFDPLHQTTSPGRFDAEAFEAFAREVTAPVLLIDGGESGLTFPGAEARRACFRDVRRAVTLEGAGHMMHWTQPSAFAAATARFLAEVFV